jgi:hypothetical protein
MATFADNLGEVKTRNQLDDSQLLEFEKIQMASGEKPQGSDYRLQGDGACGFSAFGVIPSHCYCLLLLPPLLLLLLPPPLLCPFSFFPRCRSYAINREYVYPAEHKSTARS